MSRNGNTLPGSSIPDAQAPKIAAALEKVYRHYHGQAGPRGKDRRTHDFIFHMTDWYEDLIRLSQIYLNPGKHSQREWNSSVYGFLIHAVGHLLAAAEINNTLFDPFEVMSRNKKKRARRRRVAATH